MHTLAIEEYFNDFFWYENKTVGLGGKFIGIVDAKVSAKEFRKIPVRNDGILTPAI